MKIKSVVLLLLSRILLLLGVFALYSSFAGLAWAVSAENAYVRVAHASPEAGPVDVFVDGKPLLNNFEFGAVTDYVPVPAGAHNIKVAPAGQGANAAVINENVTVNGGVPYTVAAIGTKESGFALQPFADNNLISGDTAKVRVYHLSPNAGPVDVAAGDKKVISGLTYKNASDYLNVPAGSYTFNVTATQANATVPVPATLEAGKVTSVFAVGIYNGNPALKFVAVTVMGVAGMPNSGSDPRAISTDNTGAQPWELVAGAVLLLGAGGVTAAIARARVR